MSIYLNKDSKVIVQGITGGEGSKHTARMLHAGTNVVGGVNARKAGTTVSHGEKTLPVYGTVKEAIAEEMRRDPSVFIIGEDIAEAGHPFKTLVGLVQEFGRHKVRLIRNPKRSAGFKVLVAPDVPSVLVESAFISNPAEEKKLNDPSYRRRLANAMIESSGDHSGLRSSAP